MDWFLCGNGLRHERAKIWNGLYPHLQNIDSYIKNS